MGLGSNHQTVTTGANFVPELWAKETQRATEASLVAAKLIKRFDFEFAQRGDTLHIPKISNLTATAKSAQTQVTFSSPTEDKIDLLIDKHYHIAILIEDILDAQSAYRLAEEYKGKMSYGLAKQVDTDILALQSGLSQSVGTAGVALDEATLISGIKLLDDADAPESDRSAIVAPKVKWDLIKVNRLSSADYVSDSPVVKGRFMNRFGVDFHVSTNVPVDASSNPINLLFHKEAFAAAMQKEMTMKNDYILEHLSQGYVAQVLYGVVEYRDAFGVKLLA